MQYLFSEEEYRKLLDFKIKYDAEHNAKLLALCILAAAHVPIDREWAPENKKPWGCWLPNAEHGYCDECPAKAVCPYPNKRWSK